jgi:hypothetical protein
MKQLATLPSYEDLISDLSTAEQADQLNVLLNQNPPEKWVKKHPFIKDYNYLPIDKVEFLLKRIFRLYKIEVLETKTILNTVSVSVRVHYLHPVLNEWLYHDGVGAQEIQTTKDSGSLKLDMSNINRGAIMMALPIAKTIAVKDACDHFGRLFGSDLNRKDTVELMANEKLQLSASIELSDLIELFEIKKDSLSKEELTNAERIINSNEKKSFLNLHKKLQTL